MDVGAGADLTERVNCPHTGIALAALEKSMKRNFIQANKRAVVLLTAHGLRFTNTMVA